MARVEQSYTEHSKSIDKNGKYTSAEIPYLVFDAADEDEALAAVLASAPASCRELPLESIEIDERANETTYRVNAIYREEEVSAVSDSDDDDDESPTLSFDCGGGTKHLLYSLAQKKVYGDKDAGGAQLRETYTKQMRISRLTTSYKRSVASLVGKVNSGSFKGWSAGEVMFLGMSYSTPAKKASKVTVTFNFAIQPNESNVKIGGHSVSKKGFEYAWAISKSVAAGGGPKIEVEGIYVDQVCEYASFSALGL